MQTLAGRYIGYLVLLNALLSGCLVLLNDWLFTGTEPLVGAITCLALFSLYELLVIGLTGKTKSTALPAHSIPLFMGLKVGKILLSLLVILVYMVAVKVESAHFLMVFGMLYIAYLIFDTAYLLAKEKDEKERLKNEVEQR